MYYLNGEDEIYLRGKEKNEFFSLEEAYLKGNLNKDSYINYRGYEPKKLVFNNDKERLLFEVGMYDFASHELELYLDLNPNDKKIYDLYQRYVNEYQKLKMEFENKYGALCSEYVKKDSYDYLRLDFPWEVKK